MIDYGRKSRQHIETFQKKINGKMFDNRYMCGYINVDVLCDHTKTRRKKRNTQILKKGGRSE